jgi:rhodanese-related sulfurtransferase
MTLIYLYAINERAKSGKTISPHVVTRMINSEEAILLDVREIKDFSLGHIAGAINIPYTKLNQRIPELEQYRTKAIIVADKQSQHSGSVGRKLQQEGFSALRLAGGMMEWQNQSLPVIKE